MSERRDRWFAIVISLCALALVSLPYLLAWRAAGSEYVFDGFLLNPIDGNTYLAKMLQGWQGDWRFKLPFTANPGTGAYLFLFYLSLGHLARWLNLSLLTTFHLTRLAGAAFLLWTLWHYFGQVFTAARPRKMAFALAALGSGMGWLLVFSGAPTSDFWVAETYPFLSSYINPHFPIGLALVLWLLMPPFDRAVNGWRLAAVGAGALVLSVINPFGVIIVLMVLGGDLLWRLVTKAWSFDIFWQIFVVALLGLPVLAYDVWVTVIDPVFAGWNAQNLTPSPPVWDVLISLSPALLLALAGFWGMLRKRGGDDFQGLGSASNFRSLFLWVGLGFILMYLPLGLQRRFMLGLYVPVAGLAVLGLEILAANQPRRYRFLTGATFFLACLTNLMIVFAGIQVGHSHNPTFYLTQAEYQALNWINDNTHPDALILASPEIGLFIPAYAGRRVIYGHPFETVDAESQEAAVTQFYSGDLSETQMRDFLADRQVDYVFYGPREVALGRIFLPQTWEAAFQQGDVTIFVQGAE